MKFILNLIVTVLVVLALANFLPGVEVEGALNAFWVVVVLAILNLILRPILVLLSLPITVVTLGLFLFVINALMILLTSKLLDGFSVDGFGYALLFSLCLSLVQSLIGGLLEKSK